MGQSTVQQFYVVVRRGAGVLFLLSITHTDDCVNTWNTAKLVAVISANISGKSS